MIITTLNIIISQTLWGHQRMRDGGKYLAGLQTWELAISKRIEGLVR